MKEDWKEEDKERERARLETPQVEKSEENSGSREEFWSVLEIRDAVDFEESRVVELRKKIVEIVWEPELNRDLVDRLVGVAVLRLRGPKKGRATKS